MKSNILYGKIKAEGNLYRLRKVIVKAFQKTSIPVRVHTKKIGLEFFLGVSTHLY